MLGAGDEDEHPTGQNPAGGRPPWRPLGRDDQPEPTVFSRAAAVQTLLLRLIIVPAVMAVAAVTAVREGAAWVAVPCLAWGAWTVVLGLRLWRRRPGWPRGDGRGPRPSG